MPRCTWTSIREHIEACLGRELGRVKRGLCNVRQSYRFIEFLRADCGNWNGKDVPFSRGSSSRKITRMNDTNEIGVRFREKK